MSEGGEGRELHGASIIRGGVRTCQKEARGCQGVGKPGVIAIRLEYERKPDCERRKVEKKKGHSYFPGCNLLALPRKS